MASAEEWLHDFCGQTFWNASDSWETEQPRLSRCFQQTALIGLPCLVLWALAPFEAVSIARSKSRLIPWGIFNCMRLLLAAACIFHSLVELFLAVSDRSDDQPLSDFYIPLLRSGTFILVLIFLLYHRWRGVVTSGIVWTFVFLAFCFSLPVYSQLFIQSVSIHPNERVLYFIYSPLLFVFLVACSFADKPAEPKTDSLKHQNKPSPQDNASFPSRVTFWWFTGMAYTGWKKSLTVNDLWELREDDKTKSVEPKFAESWYKSGPKTSEPRSVETDLGSKSFAGPNGEVHAKSGSKANKATKKKPGVVGALARTFGLFFLSGAFCKFINDCLAFINPQLLKWLIQLIERGTDPFWHGLLIVFCMFAVSTLQSAVVAVYYHRMLVIGLRIRSCLTSSIYRKSLVLSNSARKDTTVGEIVNLMSVDSQRFTDLMYVLNLLWSAPFQIVLAIYFLWLELGPSVLAGVAVMVLMMPINAVVAAYSKGMQVKQMKLKDERVKAMNEILNGIKVIKLYAWEESFMAQILGIRNKEVKHLKNMAYLSSVSIFLWTCAPFLVALSTFAIYVLIDDNNILDAQKAFVSLALFNLLQLPLTMLPNMITIMIMATVSVKRLDKYLNAAELDNYITHNEEIDAITIEDGTFAWDTPADGADSASINYTLKDIDLHVPKGSFLAIVGNVGTGKSSILNAMLGEMDKIKGRVNISGDQSIAYVPQQAWIQNVSLKGNILFGKPFDKRKYERVINSCALRPDLDILPGGDDTEIGEKGINLSGGQKQRVNLARACYSDADLYLMDDPLSAVDSHVAKHLFDKVLSSKTGMLKQKTRVLVTNNIALLPQVDNIIVLKDGAISEMGTYKVLMGRNKDFAEFVKTFSAQKEEEVPTSPALERQISQTKEERAGSIEQPPTVENTKKLIEAEKAETGEVKMTVYLQYFKTISWPWASMILLGFVGMQAASGGSNYWLSIWSGDQPEVVSNNGTNTVTQDYGKRNMYLIVYGILGFLQATLVCVGAFSLAKGTIDAAINLHKQLLYRILRSPVVFFDTTPLGRIVNRFAKDIDVVDNTIPGTIRGWLICLLQVLATIVMIGIVTPWFLLAILPISLVYYFIQKFYVPTSRQLKRLESITRSPIYSHFGETLAGVGTIRAYDVGKRFIEESDNRTDHCQVCCHPSIIANRWLTIRLDFCGNCIILFAALFAVISRDTIDAGLAGLSVSYAMNVTRILNWLVQLTSDLETNIVSVERILEYGANDMEAEWMIENHRPDEKWPETGVVEFRKYAARYREGLDLVIKDITTVIMPQEKIGIVGRTGAGKSTITLSLFRIIEAAGGTISIDGVNIADIGLHDLRSKITIIPQDPVLFSGTLRFNLDPFEVMTDDQLWTCLEQAHLKNFVRSLEHGLEHKVTEGGENLSVGQRQLICLARALLRKTKILVLDEATAAVDLETDSLIQSTIRSEFADCTILTIAHRLNTILDSTRVMVLDKGMIVEFDSPDKLLGDKNSVFYSLAKDAGLV